MTKWSSNFWLAAATSATASLKAGSFTCDGSVKPDTLRTNCSAASCTSCGVAGGSKLNKTLILRHMVMVALSLLDLLNRTATNACNF